MPWLVLLLVPRQAVQHRLQALRCLLGWPAQHLVPLQLAPRQQVAASGGVRGAICRQAMRAFASLPGPQQRPWLCQG